MATEKDYAENNAEVMKRFNSEPKCPRAALVIGANKDGMTVITVDLSLKHEIMILLVEDVLEFLRNGKQFKHT